MGAHPSDPATIDGHLRLDEAIKQHPCLVGDSARLEFGGHLPYLMKLLSAERPLSLQAHPNRMDARAGFERENQADILDAPERTFKDPWDKPELIVALTQFDALAGFRDPALTSALFSRLGISPVSEQVFAPLRHRRADEPGWPRFS